MTRTGGANLDTRLSTQISTTETRLTWRMLGIAGARHRGASPAWLRGACPRSPRPRSERAPPGPRPWPSSAPCRPSTRPGATRETQISTRRGRPQRGRTGDNLPVLRGRDVWMRESETRTKPGTSGGDETRKPRLETEGLAAKLLWASRGQSPGGGERHERRMRTGHERHSRRFRGRHRDGIKSARGVHGVRPLEQHRRVPSDGEGDREEARAQG